MVDERGRATGEAEGTGRGALFGPFLRGASPRAPRLKAVFLRGLPPRAPRLKAPFLLLVVGPAARARGRRLRRVSV